MDLVTIDQPSTTAISTELVTRVAEYTAASKAPNTKRAYTAAWRVFTSWCQARGVQALPALPAVVAAYVADRASATKVSTLSVHLAAIRHAHVLAGFESPTKSKEVAIVMSGIRRTHGCDPRKKAALLVGDLRAIASRVDDDVRGCRDRALLLLVFCGGLRRSEIVALDVGDAVFTSEGVTLSIRRSKTDQQGKGRTIGIGHGTQESTCPVTALRQWLACSGVTEGPLFRGVDRHGHVRAGRLCTRTVARVIKRRGKQVGLDPKVLGGHSLRSGFATSAAKAGVEERVIAKTTGHKSIAILRSYIQSATAFDGDVVRRLGL